MKYPYTIGDYERAKEALEVEYKGQCPHAKGHSSEGFYFFLGCFLGLFFAMFVGGMVDSRWETWAVHKGYGQYNVDGKVIYR